MTRPRLLCLCVCAALAFLRSPARAQLAVAAAAARGLPFQTGQVIAISDMNEDPSSLLFEGFTGSRYSHLGIIAQTEDGLYVFHSRPRAVQRTPLADYLQRAVDPKTGTPKFTLLEPRKPLTAEEQRALVKNMERMEGRLPFNYTMACRADRVNCSEFVHWAYRSIGRDHVGDPEPLSGMNRASFGGLMERAWRTATNSELPSPEANGISPVGVVNSPELRVVHAGLPVGRLLSDREIYGSWRGTGALERFSRIFKVSRDELDAAAAVPASRKPYQEYPARWRRAAD